MSTEMKQDTPSVAVFGGGCFWCTEAVFRMLTGVLAVRPGYAGGEKANPTYEEVSSGMSGHAEVIQITFNPAGVSYHDLLTVFFASHDPTTINRQGADVGTQYRSVIFTTSDTQAEEAKNFIAELNSSSEFGDPIVTEVEPLKEFYNAEDYHRNYYSNNLKQGYCRLVIDPKLEKVKQHFVALLKKNTDGHPTPMNEEELKATLTPEEYHVLREQGTEAPGSGEYLHEHTEGTYMCKVCGNPLFASDAKFESGTGWPSFDQALPGAVVHKHDTAGGMERTEVCCAKCHSHLGHVFEDGPQTTGKRFCVNSVCLTLESEREHPGVS